MPPPTAAINPPTGPLPGAAIVPALGAAATIGAAAAHAAEAPKPGAEPPGAGLPELSKPDPTPAPPPAVTAPGGPGPSPDLGPPAGPEPSPTLAPPAPAPEPTPAVGPDLVPQPAAATPAPARAPAPAPTPQPGAGPSEGHRVDIPNLDPAPPAEPATSGPASTQAPVHGAGGPGTLGARPDLAAEMGQGTWVPLPLGGRTRKEDDDGRRAPEPAPPRPEPEPETAVATGPAPAPEGSRPMQVDREATPTPAPTLGADDRDRDRDRVETVPHVVRRGENFWTISQLYYGSGRFYKALAAANDRAGPAITRIYVGQTIRIPPPEALDRHLIEPPRARTATAAAAAASVPTRPAAARGPGALEVALPTSDPFGKTRSATAQSGPDGTASNASVRPRRPQYRVHANETLRSIARDTLGDSRRADEILDLNADAIEDPHNLIPGQVLELPADARVATGPSGRDR